MTSRIPPTAVGLLGELRVDAITDAARVIRGLPAIAPLITADEERTVSRSRSYYTPMLFDEAIDEIEELLGGYNLMLQSTAASEDKSIGCYVILERTLNRLIRVAHRLLTDDTFNPALYRWIKDAIDESAAALVKAFLTPDVQTSPILRPPIPPRPPRLQEAPLRTVIEMENVPEICLFALLHRDRLADTTIVSPLLGGGVVAPVIAALCNARSWEYVALSLYDGDSGSDVRLPEGIEAVRGDVVLVDDNLGSGETLARIGRALDECGVRVNAAFAVETHWDKFIRVRAGHDPGKTFSLDGPVVPSPIAYFHYAAKHQAVRQFVEHGILGGQTLASRLIDSRALLERVLQAPWLTDAERHSVGSVWQSPLFE